jgi:diaminohydroxyphosphoribosylaminopyrimidine deaminase / 5-amino-6-(5-phosphoribosylamino)uracil reductase
MTTEQDIKRMEIASVLAQCGSGFVNPNPLVGAVIYRDDQLLAVGHHKRYGGLHAERNAFLDAEQKGVDCTGATMYVTLEPCCHQGKQPPCTDAIIAHHIKRVVVGMLDPNPLVAGKGVEKLRAAGIEVDIMPEDSEIADNLRFQNRIFLKYITSGLPWISMKYAMTLDGKICTRTGDSRWVSGERSREFAHFLRICHMGILCGIGTVLADDPMLTVRIPDLPDDPPTPVRIVADRNARIPLESNLVKTAREIPLVVAHAEGANPDKLARLQELGVQTWKCDSLQELMARAGKEQIDSILLEGGGTLNEAFLREGLVDEVFAFVAPKLIGGTDAKTPVEGLGFARMLQAVALSIKKTTRLGEDIYIQGIVEK